MNAQQQPPTQTRANVVQLVPRPRAGEPERKSSPPGPDPHESHDEPGYGHGV